MKVLPNGSRYSSFAEIAEAMGIPKIQPSGKSKKGSERQKNLQEKFLSRHKCSACGEPMTYIGGNQMVCQNPTCKGIKITKKDSEGNDIVSYVPSFHLLEDKYSDFAASIFDTQA